MYTAILAKLYINYIHICNEGGLQDCQKNRLEHMHRQGH